MKRLFLSVALAFFMQYALAQRYGYLVVYYDQDNKLAKLRTENLVDIYTLAEAIMPDNCLNFESIFNRNVYFELKSEQNYIYIEKKRINKKGKYKRIK